MRVLHLNAHASGGSYEYATLLSTGLAELGISSDVVCKNSPSAESGRPFLDRIIRRSYVSLSTEPWHGTRRGFGAPAPAGAARTEIGQLPKAAGLVCGRPSFGMLPRRMGVRISLRRMWHVTRG